MIKTPCFTSINGTVRDAGGSVPPPQLCLGLDLAAMSSQPPNQRQGSASDDPGDSPSGSCPSWAGSEDAEDAWAEEDALLDEDALAEEDDGMEVEVLVEEDDALVDEGGAEEDDALADEDGSEVDVWSDGEEYVEEPNSSVAVAKELFDDMVAALNDHGFDAELEMSGGSVVLTFQRSWFSELALQGLCWSSFDGDIRVLVDAWADTGSHEAIGMPRVRLDANTSRVFLQIQEILRDWLKNEEREWNGRSRRQKTQFLWRLERHLFEKVRKLPYLCMHSPTHERTAGYPRWRPSACDSEICKLRVREMTVRFFGLVCTVCFCSKVLSWF